jgi:hypothetical protein
LVQKEPGRSIGLVLGEMIHPMWRLLSAFAGLNMLQAAFTGFCPAALIFRKLGLTPFQAALVPSA